MKRLFLILCACAGFQAAGMAQPLVCTEPGTELEYADYNAKGKLTGYTLTRVESCRTNEAGWLVVKNREQPLDVRRNPLTDKAGDEQLPDMQTEQIVVRATDMLLPFDDLLAGIPTGEGIEISVSGDEYAIPFALEAGQALPDAKIVVAAGKDDRQVEMTLAITGRAVLAHEKITTPAGEFDAFKIAETLTVGMMIFKMTIKHVVWYAPGVGIVREEELSKKDKLENYSELVALRRPSK